ncbi:MAG: LiaI-LiaF-like domain-containing protein [Bacillota bacterium]
MQPGKVVGGFLLIAIGLIFLLNNIGLLDWSVWVGLARLWPLLIILAGVNIVFRHNRWGVIISVLVLMAGIVIALFWQSSQSSGTLVEYQWFQPLTSEINELDVDISIKGAKFKIFPTEHLAEVNQKNYGAEPQITYEERKGKGSLHIGEDTLFVWGTGWNRGGPEWNLGLNPEVLVNLDMVVGAINGDFDLSQMKIGYLNVNTGASNIDIKLGSREGLTKVGINAGASRLKIRIPRDAGVKIDASGGINRVNLDAEGYENLNGLRVSPNYATAASQVDVTVSSGVTELSIERY